MKMIWILGTLVVLISAVILIFIYSGKYNVSAMQRHFKVTQWLISTTMDKSIQQHAKDIKVPDLTGASMLRIGFIHYRQMCVDCHGAPGVQPSELSKGLNPAAPLLYKNVNKWTPAELFWITKYGIRMTGMPAWGVTHSDQKIWAIIAFLKKLQTISPEEYKKMDQSLQNNNNN